MDMHRCANSLSLCGKYIGKTRNFDGFGVLIPHFLADVYVILHGSQSPVRIYRCNVSPVG